MADQQHEHPRKHYVAGPAGRAPTEDEALEIGLALFDAINTDRIRQAQVTSPEPADDDG